MGTAVTCQSITFYVVNLRGGVRCKLRITLDDDRVSRCLEVVKRYSEGLATDEELSEAQSEAAEAASQAVAAAWSAAATWAAARSAAAVGSNHDSHSWQQKRQQQQQTSNKGGSAVGSAVSTRNQIT